MALRLYHYFNMSVYAAIGGWVSYRFLTDLFG